MTVFVHYALCVLGAYTTRAFAAPTSTDPSPNSLASCRAAMNGVLPTPVPPGFEYSGKVRRYYVAAEEVENAAVKLGNNSESNNLFNINLNDIWNGNQSVWYPQLVNLAGAGHFHQAPSFYTMKGYIFSNNPTYEMCLRDKVIWYVNAYGSASHVFHMHGNGFTYNGAHYPAIGINDGVGRNLLMNATGQGLWQVICHVNNHHELGMVSNYRVYGEDDCPLPELDW